MHYELFFYRKLKQPLHTLQAGMKRVIDFCGALGGMVFLAPMFSLIALAIKLDSPGPVFYKSLRIGKDGRAFQMYKFRSMIQDAELQRAMLRKNHRQEGALFKIKNDSRITRLGHFLRKYSLDEFPQLINVLKGEMSLIGPRPFSPDNCALFDAPYHLRFKVMPGMTGLWQVSGRSNLKFEEVCKLDLHYTLHWSLMRDLLILLRTFPVVLKKQGAF
ncbi:MAG: sugar transferase [Candidatus Melainabacteria bacterium]